MKAKRATRRLPGVMATSLGLGLAMGLGGCADEGSVAPEPAVLVPRAAAALGRDVAGVVHFTGDVDVVWNGGQGMGAPEGTDRVSHGAMDVFPGVPAGSPGPGWFTFSVVNQDGTVHRQIEVALTWAGLEDQVTNPGEIRFLGVVVSDTKPCGGSGHGEGGGCGEEGGCSGSHEEGGCSGGEEEGGCSGSHEEGGCSGGEEEGGCSGSHEEGGCSGGGGSGETGEHGGMGGGGVNGSDCRIGQVVIGWAMDGGTPAVGNDRVSWKWFAPDAPKVLAIQAAIEAGTEIPWPCKLCEKEILGGNLKLFLR